MRFGFLVLYEVETRETMLPTAEGRGPIRYEPVEAEL